MSTQRNDPYTRAIYVIRPDGSPMLAVDGRQEEEYKRNRTFVIAALAGETRIVPDKPVDELSSDAWIRLVSGVELKALPDVEYGAGFAVIRFSDNPGLAYVCRNLDELRDVLHLVTDPGISALAFHTRLKLSLTIRAVVDRFVGFEDSLCRFVFKHSTYRFVQFYVDINRAEGNVHMLGLVELTVYTTDISVMCMDVYVVDCNLAYREILVGTADSGVDEAVLSSAFLVVKALIYFLQFWEQRGDAATVQWMLSAWRRFVEDAENEGINSNHDFMELEAKMLGFLFLERFHFGRSIVSFDWVTNDGGSDVSRQISRALQTLMQRVYFVVV